MRICLLTEYFYPENAGGSPTVLSELARQLTDGQPGLELDVVTSNNLYRVSGKKLAPFEDWNGVRISRVNSPRSNRPSSAFRLAAGCLFSMRAARRMAAMRREWDLVFVNTNPPAAPAAALRYAKKTGTPFVYLIHDLYPDLPVALGMLPPGSLPVTVGRRMQRRWLHAARRVIVQGRCCRDRLADSYGVACDRIDVIPHWADPECIRPLSQSEFRQQQGLNGFVALYAGNLGPFQGLDTLLDAAPLVARGAPEVTILLVGNGSRSAQIEDRIRSSGLSNLRLMPAVPPERYADLLAAADVALVPLAEGAHGLAVPSKFYTILAAGRPTVAVLSQESEIARTVTEHDCGVQVAQGNASALADALARLSNAPDDCRRMGENAREALKSHFTLQSIAERYRSSFESAVREGGARQ